MFERISGIFFMVCLLAHGESAEGKRPNLIFIVADQLGYESCGYAGNDCAITPNIDRLAKQGMSFDNYVVNTPVCAATRATLWTGKYASSHGVLVNNEIGINPNQDCLGHLLNRKGYVCGYMGKWHLWTAQAGRRKVTEDAYCPPGPYRLGFDGFWAAHNFHHSTYSVVYSRNADHRKEIEGWGPEHFTDLAIERVEHHAARLGLSAATNHADAPPFAMILSYSTPNEPWHRSNVPSRWYDRFKDIEFHLPATWSDTADSYMDPHTDSKRRLSDSKPNLAEFVRVHYAMTAAIDEQIGRLLRSLDESRLADNTIVVLTSSHGEQFGANARVFEPSSYDESTRVPMLIRWPGRIPAGRRSNACMSAVDVLPTLCGMLGLIVPDAVDGIDLSDSTRVDCHCEPNFAFLQGMGHSSLWKDGLEWRAIRDQRYTYARYLADSKEFLFDNREDPEQAQNLTKSSEHQRDLIRLRQAMAEKMLAIGDEFKPSSWYRDAWTKGGQVLRGAKGEFHREFGDDVPVLLTP